MSTRETSDRNPEAGEADPHEFPTIPSERDIGFEPTTFSLGREGEGVAGDGRALQVGGKNGGRGDSGVGPLDTGGAQRFTQELRKEATAAALAIGYACKLAESCGRGGMVGLFDSRRRTAKRSLEARRGS
jgi:hypothetical protein